MNTAGISQGILDAMAAERQKKTEDLLNTIRQEQIATGAFNLQQARDKAAEDATARTGFGRTLGYMTGPQTAVPPVTPSAAMPPAPQAPMPGQPSVPKQSPPTARAGAAPAPIRPPVIPPYQTVQGLQQRAQTPPVQAPMGPPPVESKNQGGLKAITPDSMIAALKAQGVPPEQWVGQLELAKPLFDEAGRAQLAELKALQQANLVAHRAYQDELAKQRVDIMRKNAGGVGAGTISQNDIDSMGAQIATGEPINQVVPGYGKNAVDLRQKARSAAIKVIMKDTGINAEQAGKELANRASNYLASRSSVQQLTKMEGSTRQAVSQLELNVDNAKKEMAKLPSSDLSPVINAIARGEQKWTGDPAYSSLFYFMNAVATESARILSGGQASIAQLHQGAAEEAKQWASVNMTPASFDSVAEAMVKEGRQRIKTFEQAKSSMSVGGGGGGKTVSWSDLK